MIKLRKVQIADAERLAAIYRPYVTDTAVTLEYDPPSAREFADRIRTISGEYPYIVCELDGEPVGYAYAHRYRERYGYRFCAELSVYVDSAHTGEGLGRRLYAALIELLRLMKLQNLYGVVVDPNPASFALHRELGFYESGRDRLAGCKFGKWLDIVNFELPLGEHSELSSEREEPRRFDSLPPEAVEKILSD